MKLWNVTIIGAGYAGLLAAIRIWNGTRGKVNLTVIDSRTHFADRVHLHEAFAGNPREPLEIRRMLPPGIRLILGKVTRINPQEKTVEVCSPENETLLTDYEILLHTGGSFPDSSCLPGLAQNCFLLQSQEKAREAAAHFQGLPSGANISVIGSGLTAVEMATELAETYPHLTINMISRHPIGKGLSEAGKNYLRATLHMFKIQIFESLSVTEFISQRNFLARDEQGSQVNFSTDAIVWCGGFTCSPLLSQAGVACNLQHRAFVNSFLQSLSHSDIFCAGDAAYLQTSDQRELRMGCVSAMPMGAHAAENIIKLINGERLGEFKFSFAVQNLSLGRKRGLSQFVTSDDIPISLILTGRTAAFLKELIARYLKFVFFWEVRLRIPLYTWPKKLDWNSRSTMLRTTPIGEIEGMYFDHIALLVNSIEETSEKLENFRSLMEPIETYPGEGTRERYIGPKHASARLLLMQPANASGSYASALQKRGPGLHHLALNVTNLTAFIATLEGSGWYLLPQSLRTIQQSKTAWLGRPGIGTLLEIHEHAPKIEAPFITLVELPLGGRSTLIRQLCPDGQPVSGFQESPDDNVWLNINGNRIAVSNLVQTQVP